MKTLQRPNRPGVYWAIFKKATDCLVIQIYQDGARLRVFTLGTDYSPLLSDFIKEFQPMAFSKLEPPSEETR